MRRAPRRSRLFFAGQNSAVQAVFYLNLGEVYAASGMRERALDKLDDAMQLFGEDARLKQARSKVQNRRNPILPFFGRAHFLNRELGKLRHGALKYLVKDAK